jgi:hypothetical protein
MQNYSQVERVVRMDDFFAEQLEQNADIMPPSMADKAAILRKRALKYRTSDNAKMLTIRYHGLDSANIADDVEEDAAAPAVEGVVQGLATGQGEVSWACGQSSRARFARSVERGCDLGSRRAR